MDVSALRRIIFTPAFSSLLKQRREALILVGIGAAQMGLYLAGLPSWKCPILAVTGIPCPGCGLTTAIVDLLRGDWRTSISTHAFAPIFLLAFFILLVVSLLPEVIRQPAIASITALEQRTGFTAWVLLLLMVYWGLRLSRLI
jgi:hypothetical protein